MSTVSLKAVTKSFARDQVIHGINIDINDKEFVVIVGPSGCGKSTLLRMIAGLESVTAGEVHIDGTCVNELEPMDRNIAMVFQNYALYPHMNVFDNMAYSLKIAKVPKDEIKQRVEKAASMLQLSEYLKRKPKQLSGGQRQRVAMGRAIVRKPAVFLFDEPLSNLDAKLRVKMRLEIRQLQRELGVTSVYVTHDQVEAMTLGDKLMVLNSGKVEQYGTPIELYTRPASLFVADFIGSPSMNTIPAVAEGSQLTLSNGTTLQSPFDYSGEVKLGIRPEHFVLASEQTLTEDSLGEVQLQVLLLEQLGSNTLVHGKLQGTDIELVFSMQGIFTEQQIGSMLLLSIPRSASHLFNASSGTRLEATT